VVGFTVRVGLVRAIVTMLSEPSEKPRINSKIRTLHKDFLNLSMLISLLKKPVKVELKLLEYCSMMAKITASVFGATEKAYLARFLHCPCVQFWNVNGQNILYDWPEAGR
jgi:hypothetical protein